jgi:hypothetical protein
VNLIWETNYSNGDIPHATNEKGSFWWKDLLKLCDLFRGIATCTLGNRQSVLFWEDTWNNRLLKESFPRLYSFARNKGISVAKFLQNNDIQAQFYIPLTPEAFQEFQDLQEIIQGLQVEEMENDNWQYIWRSGTYSAKIFYNLPFKNIKPPSPFLWIWDSRCSNQLRSFSWLLLMDRLNTSNLLRRRNYNIEDNNYSCELCNDNLKETAFDLFFSCSFSKSCWQVIGIEWRSNLNFFQMMKRAKQEFNHWFFTEVFIAAAWHIWKQRNNAISEGRRPTVRNWTSNFVDEARLQAQRIKDSKRQEFLNWINLVHI